jgi:hypothetical protein
MDYDETPPLPIGFNIVNQVETSDGTDETDNVNVKPQVVYRFSIHVSFITIIIKAILIVSIKYSLFESWLCIWTYWFSFCLLFLQHIRFMISNMIE